ncbi:permease-like cell division protein FtsX [Spirillospora sp. CA-142024]|uniref:permease-like cell division protein FtsX n=1 Tax=Spirillospora sp. CA-142024 TaxID=3240036 RepID=UPI003D92D611
MTEPEERPEDTGEPPARRPRTWMIVGAAVVAVLLTGGALAASFYAMHDESDASQPGERQVSVYFCIRSSTAPSCRGREATDLMRQTVTQRVKAMPKVRSVVYESQQQAYERAKKLFKDRKDLLDALSPGDVPDSLRLRVADTAGAEAVKAALAGAAGVEDVVIQPLRPRA